MSGWLFIAAAGVTGAGWWLGHLWLHPYARCYVCKGSGRNPGSTSKAFGRCLKCGGAGERARLGARLVRKELRK